MGGVLALLASVFWSGLITWSGRFLRPTSCGKTCQEKKAEQAARVRAMHAKWSAPKKRIDLLKEGGGPEKQSSESSPEVEAMPAPGESAEPAE